MFSRIKSAIDKTIEQEQARQKALSDQPGAAHTRQSSSVSRSNSAASGASKRPRQQKKSGQDASKDKDGEASAVNPDPAVFEAAFVIDDEEPSRTATPAPTSNEKKSSEHEESKGGGTQGDTEAESTGKDPEKNGGDDTTKKPDSSKPLPTPKTAATELPPDVRARLRKLEKLEGTYPG